MGRLSKNKTEEKIVKKVQCTLCQEVSKLKDWYEEKVEGDFGQSHIILVCPKCEDGGDVGNPTYEEIH